MKIEVQKVRQRSDKGTDDDDREIEGRTRMPAGTNTVLFSFHINEYTTRHT